MSEVWKYDLLASEDFVLALPEGAKILTVQVQHDKPQLWALVDPKAAKVPRRFGVFGTGHRLPSESEGFAFRYVGTFQLEGGRLVFHLFEDREPRSRPELTEWSAL